MFASTRPPLSGHAGHNFDHVRHLHKGHDWGSGPCTRLHLLYLYVCSSFPPLGRLSVLLTYLNIWNQPETRGLVTAEPHSR